MKPAVKLYDLMAFEVNWIELQKVIKWINLIDFKDWPQQSQTELKPAMAHGDWHGLQEVTDPLVKDIMQHVDGKPDLRMLSVIMPGKSIEAHSDPQEPDWLTRLHIPLTTNDQSIFYIAGQPNHFEVGKAYHVDTRVEHAIENKGTTPRIHFMLDIKEP